MYSEMFCDFIRIFIGWKCLNCGEIIDPVIVNNRARNASEATETTI
jgi:hypothetical protein